MVALDGAAWKRPGDAMTRAQVLRAAHAAGYRQSADGQRTGEQLQAVTAGVSRVEARNLEGVRRRLRQVRPGAVGREERGNGRGDAMKCTADSYTDTGLLWEMWEEWARTLVDLRRILA